jgi:hypothetical protein
MLEREPRTEFCEEVDDIARRQIMQIAKTRPIAEHEIVDVIAWIRGAKDRAGTARELDRVRPRRDNPTARDDWDFIDLGHGYTCAT